MSNPLAVPTTPVVFPLGPGQTQDNLTALPSGYARSLGIIGSAGVQYYDDNIAPLQVRSGPGANNIGAISLYLIVSEDRVIWTDGIDPTSTADQSAKIIKARLISSFNNVAPSTVYVFDGWSVFTSFDMGYMPTFWSVVVLNQSGGSFDPTASNFSAKHTLVSYA